MRTNYLRDSEHIRRLAEGLKLDKSIPPDVQAKLIVACELIHATISVSGDVATMRAILTSKIALLVKSPENQGG
jgi:hypothetical protein